MWYIGDQPNPAPCCLCPGHQRHLRPRQQALLHHHFQQSCRAKHYRDRAISNWKWVGVGETSKPNWGRWLPIEPRGRWRWGSNVKRGYWGREWRNNWRVWAHWETVGGSYHIIRIIPRTRAIPDHGKWRVQGGWKMRLLRWNKYIMKLGHVQRNNEGIYLFCWRAKECRQNQYLANSNHNQSESVNTCPPPPSSPPHSYNLFPFLCCKCGYSKAFVVMYFGVKKMNSR